MSEAAKQVGIAWRLTSQSGWGVLGINLTLELARQTTRRVVPLTDAPALAGNPILSHTLRPSILAWRRISQQLEASKAQRHHVGFPVIHSLGNDLAIHPKGRSFFGAEDLGIVFLEKTGFSAQAHARAKRFKVIAAGSRWAHEVLKSAGFSQTIPWAQGIDPSIFHPAPRPNSFPDRFVIFSGGKPEFRKGQDLVIAAFKAFQQRRPDALLLTAWYTPWPKYAQDLGASMHLKGPPPITSNDKINIAAWLRAEGLSPESFVDVGLVPNPQMPRVLLEADVALFPNRAEGGTNLVAMEALACGLPTILSDNTGHKDLIAEVPCYALERQRTVVGEGREDWGESDLEEIVERLDAIYLNRAAARDLGLQAARAMESWSWQRMVAELITAFELSS